MLEKIIFSSRTADTENQLAACGDLRRSTIPGLRGRMWRMIDFRSARISDHGRLAMIRREVTEAQVREVLRAPQAVVPGNRPGRQVAEDPVKLGDRRTVLLRVVVDTDRKPPEVVTAYATTQFARYGAKR